MPTPTGGFRLQSVKLTSTDALGYSADLLAGEAVTGTFVSYLQIRTASTNTGSPQAPNHTGKVVVYLYSTTGPTYYELDAFSLLNLPDALQWSRTFSDLVLPDDTWSIRFSSRQTALAVGCELHLAGWGQDMA